MSKTMTWALRGAIAVSGLLAGIGLLPSSNASATERLAAGNTAHPIPGIVEPYCKDEGQLSLNRCAANWLSLTTEMHYIVQAEMFLRLPVEQEIQMALAGDAWVEFKEAHCALVAEEVEGGSLYPMVLNRCLARVTNERIAALRGWGTAPVDRAATETRLQTAYLALADPSNGEGPRLEMAQVHWETYRTQHCQLEGALQTEPEAEADCLARLAAERTAQLQEIMGRRG